MTAKPRPLLRKQTAAPSTRSVGRGKPQRLELPSLRRALRKADLCLTCGDSLEQYDDWEPPDCIISDGAYGVLGFEGDTANHQNLADWYEPHVAAWARKAKPCTTLWFWNSEIGWAVAHPVLERYGFKYVSCNIWNKGPGHIAGNVSTKTIRRFPVVTEICAHYVFEPKLHGLALKQWLLREWTRTGLPLSASNLACQVRDAATRKYLNQGHLWYFPPPDKMAKLARYASAHGKKSGRPYFALDGKSPVSEAAWAQMRARFECPHGITNVWDRPALRDDERIKNDEGKAVHLNQKPLDLLERLIEATTVPGDSVWEPFGGLFSASLAARNLSRKAFGSELDPVYFSYGIKRF